MNLVFFDFDDTLTALDTTLPFGAFIAGQRRARHRLALFFLARGLFRFRLVSNTGVEKTYLRLFLRGQTTTGLHRMMLQFCDTQLDTLTDHEILGKLQAHVARGDRVYIVSANYDCLLEPLVERWSLAGVIATHAENISGIYTGGVVGAMCHGQEKLRRAVAQFGQAAVDGAIAYGNREDAPLLRAVRTGYLISRARPPGLIERLRQWRRILAGTLNRGDLSAPRNIELFPAACAPEPVAPSDA